MTKTQKVRESDKDTDEHLKASLRTLSSMKEDLRRAIWSSRNKSTKPVEVEVNF